MTHETSDPTVASLCQSIAAHFERHQSAAANTDEAGEAFVAALYGPWGIGKTRVLRLTERHFDTALKKVAEDTKDADAPPALVVPVFFSAWRFEKEPHLIVPLVKTIELALRKYLALDVSPTPNAAPPSWWSKFTQRLGQGVTGFGHVAAGLTGMFKVKAKLELDAAQAAALGLLGTLLPQSVLDQAGKAGKLSLELELDPSKFADIVGQRKKEQAKDSDAETSADADAAEHALIANHDSIYFNTTQYLARICEPQEGEHPGLKFVVLVDDLDRCLPEKAVEMLESIKLFLDIPAFAFVMGVDNEVIERGIMHRYKDYVAVPATPAKPSHDAQADDAHPLDAQLRMPITGSEYLEKIIHLPVHLSYQTTDQATALLRTYRTRFEAVLQQIGEFYKKPVPVDTLLALIARITPPVPRKLIRLAESGLFQLQLLHDCLGPNQASDNLTRQINPYLVVRLQALQLFYPALHRLLKRDTLTWPRLGLSKQRPDGVLTYEGRRLHDLEQALSGAERGAPSQGAPDKNALQDTPQDKAGTQAAPSTEAPRQQQLHKQVAFMRALTYSCQQRGADKPLVLFAAEGGQGGAATSWVDQPLMGWPTEESYPIYLYPQQARAVQACEEPAPELGTSPQVSAQTSAVEAQDLFDKLQTLWQEDDFAAFTQNLANLNLSAFHVNASAPDSALRQLARCFDPAQPDYKKWLINREMLNEAKITLGGKVPGHMLHWHTWGQRLRDEGLLDVWEEEQHKLRAKADMVWTWRAGEVGGAKVYSPRFQSTWTSEQAQHPDTASAEAQDLVTGHVWCRYAEGQKWDDRASLPARETEAFQWGKGEFIWSEAAPMRNWRVPDIHTLRALVDPAFSPKIDSVAFPECPARRFWSSSPDAGYSDYAWNVNFSYGYDDFGYKGNANRVRLVRSGP